MKAIAPYYLISVINEILTSALRGLGVVRVPTIINILTLCIGRIIWVKYITAVKPSLYMIVLSCPVTWLAAAALVGIFYLFSFSKTLNRHKEA